MSSKVTKNELKRIFRMYFQEAKSRHQRDYALKSFNFWVSKHSQLLDTEAMDLVSDVVDIYIKQLEEYANGIKDGKDKRKIIRQIATTKGEHFSFANITQTLYQKPSESLEMNKLTEDIFLKIGQLILDYLYDVPKNSIKKDDYTILVMYHLAVDELLSSFHLAQHSFSSQSIHHSRTVLEIIDLAELFQKGPKWIDFWSDENIEQKEKWGKLSPAKVRRMLGRVGKDQIYSQMSEMGTHITSYFMKTKAKERIEIKKGLRKKVTIKIGGSSEDWACVAANNFCVYSASMLLNRLAGNFKKYLSEEEVIGKTLEITEDLKEYFLKGYLEFSKKRGKDVAGMEDFIKKMKIDY